MVLHSDLNSFYASVEIMLNPALRGKAVAVCGSTESRHGIVLAKSELAKKAGVKTGMANWEAREACPNLIIVPPQYDQYLKYSKLAREIYYRYTDLVEPFGMDECWCAFRGNEIHAADGHVYDSVLDIAEKIRESMREELGLTVSIGVAFTKIYAKLASDMKKPDAITVITIIPGFSDSNTICTRITINAVLPEEAEPGNYWVKVTNKEHLTSNSCQFVVYSPIAENS